MHPLPCRLMLPYLLGSPPSQTGAGMAERVDVARVIGLQLAALQRQASAAGMPALAYLIEMARREAASQAGDDHHR